MGRLGVALVLSLSAAGLVSDASAARSLGASAVSSLGAGSGADLHADGSAVDATAFFPEELNGAGPREAAALAILTRIDNLSASMRHYACASLRVGSSGTPLSDTSTMPSADGHVPLTQCGRRGFFDDRRVGPRARTLKRASFPLFPLQLIGGC